MSEVFYVVPEKQHNALVEAAYRHRGYLADEAAEGARFCAEASRHGIRTHNGLKALHLDHLFGSGSQGCVPGAKIEVKPSPRFPAAQVWNANKKLGQSVAYRAMDEAMKLADKYGCGTISVDNAFHYLWGGGYVMDAAQKGYIAYTNCTASLAEVVPFGGKFPTLGTNPQSWGFPTTEAGRLPHRRRLGHVRRRHGPRAAAGSARASPSRRWPRSTRTRQSHHRSQPRGLAAALRRAQGIRPFPDQRDRRRLHWRLAPHHPQSLGRRRRRSTPRPSSSR